MDAWQTTPRSRDPDWEQRLIKDLVMATLAEQRRARRWGIFFKSLTFLYLLLIFLAYAPSRWTQGPLGSQAHTALVDIEGVIGPDGDATADSIIAGLRAAYEDTGTKGIIVRINSPGGSAVHAGYVNDEIVRLRALHPKVPLYAVITDICASGGYYIAVAADRIYADKASLVGSIGVLMDSFGFVGTLDRLGIERRLFTAGEHKGFLDPFSPAKADDVQHLKGVLGQVHRQFINVVRKGRGERVKDREELFTGLIWSGEQGVKLGLVDALGSSGFVAREVIGAEEVVDFTQHELVLNRLASRFGTLIAKALAMQAGSIPMLLR